MTTATNRGLQTVKETLTLRDAFELTADWTRERATIDIVEAPGPRQAPPWGRRRSGPSADRFNEA